MKATTKKRGIIDSIRKTAATMDTAHLELDQTGDAPEENRSIFLETSKEHTVSLDKLVAGITTENIHDEIDFGSPVVQEVDI